MTNSSENVDLRSLTWSQRERVLNVLFARINGGGGRGGGVTLRKSPSPHPKLRHGGNNGGGGALDMLHPLNLEGTSPPLNDTESDRKYVNGRVGVSVTPKSRESTLLEIETLNADNVGSRVHSVGRLAELA